MFAVLELQSHYNLIREVHCVQEAEVFYFLNSLIYLQLDAIRKNTFIEQIITHHIRILLNILL